MNEGRGHRKQVVPDELTTDDVMRVFGWSRSEVSRRRRSGDLPEPDPWRGSPRKPRWTREAVMDSLARLGLLGGVVAGAFEGDLSSPVRWGFTGAEFVTLPQLDLGRVTESTNLYRVLRYLRRDDGPTYADTPEFQLSVCIAVDDPSPFHGFEALLVRSEIAHTLGYGQGEAGTIAVILPRTGSSDPQLRFARIPADFPADHVIRLEEVPAAQIPVAAHLLGHPLPGWTEEEITRNGIAQWDPARWSAGNADPVVLKVPRALTEANMFRRTTATVVERIGTGEIAADSDVAAGLQALMSRSWDVPLANLRRRGELPPGWAWVFELPEPNEFDFTVDDGPALRWLAASPDAPGSAAEFATRYFGYGASTGVTLLDLRALTPETRAAVTGSLEPVEAGESWLDVALERQLVAAEIEGQRSFWRWTGDPEPGSHPCVRVGEVLAFHVPRSRFPLTVPAYAEAAVTTRGERHWYAAFAVDVDGHAAPLPLRPPLDKQAVGAALTAAIWAPTTELVPGPAGIIGNIPAGVRQLLALLDTGEALQIDWDELSSATGPGPGPHASRGELFVFRQGDPPVEAH
ncbi:hypothetical protein ACGFQG_32090 [Nocardia fluminea]|uniref:hypothetical protein n=1 Tax=Nocardia fluminea TaxID=134984 RepID=UPI003713D2A7